MTNQIIEVKYLISWIRNTIAWPWTIFYEQHYNFFVYIFKRLSYGIISVQCVYVYWYTGIYGQIFKRLSLIPSSQNNWRGLVPPSERCTDHWEQRCPGSGSRYQGSRIATRSLHRAAIMKYVHKSMHSYCIIHKNDLSIVQAYVSKCSLISNILKMLQDFI